MKYLKEKIISEQTVRTKILRDLYRELNEFKG
jgi:hypothetical protein